VDSQSTSRKSLYLSVKKRESTVFTASFTTRIGTDIWREARSPIKTSESSFLGPRVISLKRVEVRKPNCVVLGAQREPIGGASSNQLLAEKKAFSGRKKGVEELVKRSGKS